MGQASVMEFLQRYRKSKKYEKKKWLTVKEIHCGMDDTKYSPAIGSITTSIKKLRDSNMVYYKEIPLRKSGRMIMHYRAK